MAKEVPVVIVRICRHGTPKCLPCWMCERDASGRWYYWPTGQAMKRRPFGQVPGVLAAKATGGNCSPLTVSAVREE